MVPSERFYAPLPSDADEYDRGHVDGWNACRQALLAQRGQGREGKWMELANTLENFVPSGGPGPLWSAGAQFAYGDVAKTIKAMLAAAPDTDAEGK